MKVADGPKRCFQSVHGADPHRPRPRGAGSERIRAAAAKAPAKKSGKKDAKKPGKKGSEDSGPAKKKEAKSEYVYGAFAHKQS